jgi:hypothetical protein
MPKDSLSAHKGLMANWPHHNILAVSLGKEEVASPGVVEEKCERIVRFEVIWDDFGNNLYPET